MKVKDFYKKAKKMSKTIVFPEAAFSARTIEAVKIIAKKKIAKPLLIGDESALILRDKALSDFQIINPVTFAHKDEGNKKSQLHPAQPVVGTELYQPHKNNRYRRNTVNNSRQSAIFFVFSFFHKRDDNIHLFNNPVQMPPVSFGRLCTKAVYFRLQ